MEDIGTFFGIYYGHLVSFIAIWCSLSSFGIFSHVLVNYIYAVPRKIWQSCLQVRENSFAL
jgi:hypothetical protein